MYVCICKNVSDSQVRSAIEKGARTVEAVGRATRAGTCCGACHDEIDDLIDRHAKVTAKERVPFGQLIGIGQLSLAG